MVFDESSFDASMMPNVKLPPGYRDRFRSSDGKLRSFVPKLHRVPRARYLDQPAVGFVSSFAQDPVTSEVYVTTLDSEQVYRLEPSAP